MGSPGLFQPHSWSGGDKYITTLADNWLFSHYIFNYVHHICSDHFLAVLGAGLHYRRHRGEAREVLRMGKGYDHGEFGDEEKC